LAQTKNGDFYGTATGGGGSDKGTVFKIAGSTFTAPYSLCSKSACADGDNPNAGLILATNGDLYGTTEGGGATALAQFMSLAQFTR
jgi:uncharacterized repeat protein (TIGR03803 family)